MALLDNAMREIQTAQTLHDTQVNALTAQVNALNVSQATLRAQLATCKATLPPVTPPAYPSGFAPQIGDRPGWKQVWFDDFKQPVAEGGFHLAYPKINAYNKGWQDTQHSLTHAQYQGWDYCSVSEDRLKVRLWTPTDGTYARVTALGPNNDAGLLGMRVACAVRLVNAVGGYHPIPILTWPKDELWPAHGEIDFPESDSNALYAMDFYTHWANPNGGQNAHQTGNPLWGESKWHLLEYEWLSAKSCTYWIDGKQVGQDLNGVNGCTIPSTPHRWVMQLESSWKTIPGTTTTVEFDWAGQWSVA